MFRIALLILVKFLLVSADDDLENLLSDVSNSETECVEFVKSEGYQYKSSHVPLVMRKGYWQCSKDIITIAQQSGSDVRNIFDLESRILMKEIAGLKAVVESSLPISSITPSFQWAQSPNEIFINVKFAHKLDAPATLNVEEKNVTVNGHYLYLQATDGRKNFVLEMDLLREVNSSESTWSMASVGRMVFTLKKMEAPSRWSRLLKSKKKPQNMHSWWELMDKHRDELERLDESDRDDDEDDSFSSKSNKSKAATKTKSADSSPNTTTTTETVDDEIGKGSIETPEMETKRLEKEKIEQDLKSKVKGLEDEMKKKKREVDTKCREEKVAIEKEFRLKRDELEATATSATAALETSSTTTSTTPLKTEL